MNAQTTLNKIFDRTSRLEDQIFLVIFLVDFSGNLSKFKFYIEYRLKL